MDGQPRAPYRAYLRASGPAGRYRNGGPSARPCDIARVKNTPAKNAAPRKSVPKVAQSIPYLSDDAAEARR